MESNSLFNSFALWNQIINQTKQLGIQNNHLIEAKKQVNEQLIHRHSVLDTYAQKVRKLK